MRARRAPTHTVRRLAAPAGPVSPSPAPLERDHVPELARARRVAQLRQRLRLDLTDALPREGELPANLLEGSRLAGDEPEAQRQDLLLPVGERVEHGPQALLTEGEGRSLEGALRVVVLDEVAELGVVVAHVLVDRDGLRQNAERLPYLVGRHLRGKGDLVDGRLAAELLEELRLDLAHPVERLDHVDRDPDGPGLVGDGAGDRLPDPPG